MRRFPRQWPFVRRRVLSAVLARSAALAALWKQPFAHGWGFLLFALAAFLAATLVLVIAGAAIARARRARRFRKVVRDFTERKPEAEDLDESGQHIERGAAQPTADLKQITRDLEDEIARRADVEAALRQSEARARGMFETAVDAIVTINEKGIIDSFNPAAEKLFDYRQEEVIGKNVNMLMPLPHAGEHDGYLKRYVETGEARIIGIGREVVARKKNGETFPIDLAVGCQRIGSAYCFTGMIRDLSERKRLEMRILQISGREQQRIGQDLHDGLGQHLTGASLFSKSLAGRLALRDLPEARDADYLATLLGEAVSQARGLVKGLQPVPDGASLCDALEEMTAHASRVFSVACAFSADEASREIGGAEASGHLYRIAQESVNNAIRHGQARHIAVSLSQIGGARCLRVEDDGLGFTPAAAPTGGLGLRIMAYRARMIGGTIDVRSKPGGGCTVTCMIAGDAGPARAKEDLP